MRYTVKPGIACSVAMMATPPHKRVHESYQMPVDLIMLFQVYSCILETRLGHCQLTPTSGVEGGPEHCDMRRGGKCVCVRVTDVASNLRLGLMTVHPEFI